jgi:hypothetical protein
MREIATFTFSNSWRPGEVRDGHVKPLIELISPTNESYLTQLTFNLRLNLVFPLDEYPSRVYLTFLYGRPCDT